MSNPDDAGLSFGNFCFDLKRLRLSTASRTIPLKRQSAEVLALLLKDAGQTVTREAIRDHVWHDRTIEFDHGINAAIRDIRQALGDDSKSPRFVETQPKVGYRFIEEIEQSDPNSLSPRRGAFAVMGAAVVGAMLLGMVIVGVTSNSGTADIAGTEPSRLAVMPIRVAEPGSTLSDMAEEWTSLLVRELAENQQQVLIISADELFGDDRQSPSMADMSRWLEADYLLAGTFDEAGDVQSLNLRLIQTDGYVHIWSKTIPIERGDQVPFTPLIAEIVSAIDLTGG